MKFFYILLFIFINNIQLLAQETNLIKYFNGFTLNEGIYLSFLNLKQNKPISKANILTDINPNSFYFYELLLQEEKFKIITTTHDTIEIATKAVWGYSQNGVVYIQLNGNFSRIHQLGALSHFIGKKTVLDNHFANTNSGYWGNPINQPNTHQEIQEYILDFETGNFSEFNLKSLETLLKRDENLFNEFNALSYKKKRQLMYFYLKKYNEKHPIYFPIE